MGIDKIAKLKEILPYSMRENVDWHISNGREPIQHMLVFYSGQVDEYQEGIDKMVQTQCRPNDSTGTLESNMTNYMNKRNEYRRLVGRIQRLIDTPNK